MKFKPAVIAPLGMAAIAMGASIVAYPMLPETVTIHWDLHGKPDGHAPKLLAAVFLPLVMWLLPLLQHYAHRAEPRRDNLERSKVAVDAIRIAVGALLLVVHLVILANAIGIAISPSKVALYCIGVMLMVVGNYMGKTRSNFVIGIRNRWTLSSERVWDRTHRMAGRLFVVEGLAAIVLTIVGQESTRIAVGTIAVLAVTLLFLQAYSYSLWKHERVEQ